MTYEGTAPAAGARLQQRRPERRRARGRHRSRGAQPAAAHPDGERDGLDAARRASSAPAPPRSTSTSGPATSRTSSALHDRLHAYYAFQKDERGEPNLQGNTIPGFGDTRSSHRQIGTLNDTHIFGSNVVNEARFGFNRINITFAPNVQDNPADYGINNGITTAIALPQITVQGLGLNFGGPNGFPQGRTDTTFVLSDTVTYGAGPARAQVRRRVPPLPQRELPEQRRHLHLSEPRRLPGGTRQRLHRHARRDRQRHHPAGVRALRPGQLAGSAPTADPGARPPLRPERGAHARPTTASSTSIPATVSLVQVGQGGRDKIYGNKNNFQPRVGLVWDPFGDGRTSVRAAYAILSDQPVTNVVTPTASNPPLVTPLTFTGRPIRLDNALAVAGPGRARPRAASTPASATRASRPGTSTSSASSGRTPR